jgi:ATP-dependent Lhr-like helicase
MSDDEGVNPASVASGPLRHFSVAARAWFEGVFEAPTPAQAGAWEAIAGGSDTLVVAPTGSGKTLAAFFWSLDRLASGPPPEAAERLRVLYISPLKALAVDIERNLRSPLAGMRAAAQRLGENVPDVAVGIRTGDTPAEERRRFPKTPPDILITTPESLYLLLTSAARDALRHVDTVIVDEVHAVAATKRGSHLALSLERLDELLEKPARRIGLSATVRPVEEVARFLCATREVKVVAPESPKSFDLSVMVPVEDMSELGNSTREIRSGSAIADVEERKSIWPSIEERLVELIQAHRSTIVFANSRRLAERICARLNDLAEKEIARAHHGSVSKEQRREIEEALKAGRLPAVVATSSLELGIDMGAVDLVVQIESPPSVAHGLQRIGRAGHQVGATSRGVILPKFRGDLVECAVVVERMKQGDIEALHYPRNPLDVLAQQVVAMVAMEEWDAQALLEVVRRAAPFTDLPQSAFDGVLDMLSGRYPSDEFAELRPRLVWDRVAGKLTTRAGAQRLAVTSGGTIPDRGLFGVFLAGEEKAARVGELDEEMVYESRVTDVFVLGSTSWRIEDITHDRVLVSPAPGEHARMPFWRGDAPGRPVELGRAVGAFLREISNADKEETATRLRACGLDDLAAQNLMRYLGEQIDAAGHLPSDRTIVVERFRDELGDWRVCIHSPFGALVHAPWSLAIESRVAERTGFEVQTMYTDDGIVVRFPEAEEAPSSDLVIFDPEEIEQTVTDAVGGSALFAARFRECAARALLLPKRRPGQRMPLWQQRQRSANLLQVASQYGSFPILMETMRECLQDVFDLPGLVGLMADVRSRRVRVVEVDAERASPFAASLLFGYVGSFIYEGDSPLAERRAQALSLDTALLAELLGRAELRELIDPRALEEVELELQRMTPPRKLRHIDDTHDALRSLGDLTTAELIARGAEPGWLHELEAQHRAIRLRIAGEERWAAVEDAARFRDALGSALPLGVPDAFTEPVADPLGDLVSRYARTHGPFVPEELASRLGLGVAVVVRALASLEARGRVVKGEFRPGGSATEWCDAEVLRMLRRRSLAKLRHEIEPVDARVLARFYPAWQGVGGRGRGRAGVFASVEQLQGAAVPASMLEGTVLSSRVMDYNPALLDELCASGEVAWMGRGPLGSSDGWVSLYLAETLPLLRPPAEEVEIGNLERAVLDALASKGATFFRQIGDEVGATDDRDLLDALWNLVWAGRITNDTVAPLRSLIGKGRGRPARPAPPSRRRPYLPSRPGPPAGAGRWSLLPDLSPDPTRRAHALADQLLERHGVLTRGAVVSERVPGGFAAVYGVLKQFEEAGRCRRGYFVDGLGAAQFGMPGAVDRMRNLEHASNEQRAVVLAAADPANPFGAALDWPPRAETTNHQPGRKAGALVVIFDGSLALYVEKGGRSLLTFTEDPEVLQSAADALALAAREGGLGRLRVEKADGEEVFDTPLAAALAGAGFRSTGKDLRLRA